MMRRVLGKPLDRAPSSNPWSGFWDIFCYSFQATAATPARRLIDDQSLVASTNLFEVAEKERLTPLGRAQRVPSADLRLCGAQLPDLNFNLPRAPGICRDPTSLEIER
jgi:hypothetical protein